MTVLSVLSVWVGCKPPPLEVLVVSTLWMMVTFSFRWVHGTLPTHKPFSFPLPRLCCRCLACPRVSQVSRRTTLWVLVTVTRFAWTLVSPVTVTTPTPVTWPFRSCLVFSDLTSTLVQAIPALVSPPTVSLAPVPESPITTLTLEQSPDNVTVLISLSPPPRRYLPPQRLVRFPAPPVPPAS